MTRFRFWSRKELQLLSSEWDADESRLLILYGRRRVERLAWSWTGRLNAAPRALYWVAEPTSSVNS